MPAPGLAAPPAGMKMPAQMGVKAWGFHICVEWEQVTHFAALKCMGQEGHRERASFKGTLRKHRVGRQVGAHLRWCR